MSFLLIAVTLDMDIAMFGVQKLSYGRPGASALALSGPFWQHLWGSWGQQEGHLGVQIQMTESTLWSNWSCSLKALAF